MRLIDADELRKQMYHEAFETDTDMQRWDGGCWIRYKMFENAIESAPTVDPVKHGRWIDDYNETEHPLFRKAWKCSACGFRTSYGKPKYCMNCGARMDGESNET